MQNLLRLVFVIHVLLLGVSSPFLKAQEITLFALHFPPHVIDSNIIPLPLKSGQKNTIYGLDVDLVREAYASQGVNVHIKILPWKRLMRDVEKGKSLGAITCRKVYPRETFAYFSHNVTPSINTLVTRKNFLDSQNPTLDVLNRYQNIAVEGWSQTNILGEANIPYESVVNMRQGLNLILRRDKEVFIVAKANAVFTANRLGMFEQLSFYDVKGGETDYYPVCFSKAYPDAKKWRDMLNKGLDEIKSNGLWKTIFLRYGISDKTIQ